MKRRTTVVSFILGGLILSVLLSMPAFSGSTRGPLFASPIGRAEIPDADPDGTGGFTAIIDGDQFCYGLTVTNLDQPVGAHIHRGNAGENGPVVIPLTPPSNGDPGVSSACVTANTALLAEILQKPSQFYVNVHTEAFPGGAIRDQLSRTPR